MELEARESRVLRATPQPSAPGEEAGADATAAGAGGPGDPEPDLGARLHGRHAVRRTLLPTIEISTSLPSVRVVQVLEQLVAMHGAPAMLRCDNGPEFIAAALMRWCEQHGVVLHHIQPGKPNQNAFIERFNRTYRHEVLDAWVFTSLAEVRQVTEEWLELYNTARPHRSLGRVPPRTFLPRNKAA